MKEKKRAHLVFLKTNLNFDGRVFSLINTLSFAYTNDEIIVYNYDVNVDETIRLQKNTRIIYFKSFFEKFNKFKVFRALRLLEYSINSFFKLIYYRPESIQLHHEVTLIAPLLYKFFNRKVTLVYDDKEFYHYKNKNISPFFYFIEKSIIRWSELLIITNEYRRKAVFKMNKNKIKKHIIVDNFEFKNQFSRKINNILLDKLNLIKNDNKKILLHQGVISKERGAKKLVDVIETLPFDWKLCFIGVSQNDYEKFEQILKDELKNKIKNFGYVDYNELSDFYKYVDGAVLFYDVYNFNNKYCAPNRLYSAANNGVPIIVNEDNFTLSTFVRKFKNGVCFSGIDDLKIFFSNYSYFKKNADIMKNNYEHKEMIPELYKFYKNDVLPISYFVWLFLQLQ
ncbi:glycosyltransferase [Chryseobacterium sp. S90]|uniref:glycosyltransferase n=1 Tax=Chryseobacterium sp. S90 TaxID=3395373 RepID=UPI0039BC3591